MSDEYILEMIDIVKTFPGVQALKGVQLKLRRGAVHGLMGENGAGKSTLMKCLIGIHPPTSGKIVLKDKEVKINNPHNAAENGIAMVHQELNPVAHRTVMENVWLGREPKKGFLIDHKKMYSLTKDLLATLELDVDPKEIMGTLSVAKMQMIEIAKAISQNAEIIIMDEPTSALTSQETVQLFKIIRQLKEQNVAIVYISHKMDEIFEICDEITVFRDGEYISTDPIGVLDMDKLVTKMVGREISEMFPKVDCEIGEVILSVNNLSSQGVFENVSFDLRKGEILGIAGLVGAGRTELVETIFGMRKASGGTVAMHGNNLTITSPMSAIKNKFGMVTEDRRHTGILPVLSVASNMTISSLEKYKNKLGLIIPKIVSDYVNRFKNVLSIKMSSTEQLIQNLSGGNQQKVLVARCLINDPEVIILDEPTRGIDVGAKAEIHSLITKLAGEGKSIIMISSEMPEVIGMSDRILVMREGKMSGIVERTDVTQELLMRLASL